MKNIFSIVILLPFLFSSDSFNGAIKMTPVEKLLNDEIKNGNTPSVQYYIFDQHKIISSFQQGFADIKGKKRVDSTTTYHAFSVTKTFTALAILQLAANGKIDLEREVIRYLPEFPYGSEITIKHLLGHTSGIPNPMPLAWIHLENEHKSFDRNKFFAGVIEKHKKLKSKPNEKLAYSNLGYLILGQLIEEVSGKTYEQYVEENILRKLPINQSDLAFTIPALENHATGYHKRVSFSSLLLGLFLDKSKFMGANAGKWRSFKNFYVNGSSYGGLIVKPTALIKYIQELLKSNSGLIPDNFKTQLFAENKTNNGVTTDVCLGWFLGELNGNRYYAHAGGGGGYYCEVRIYPELKMGSVVFMNRSGMSDERFLSKVDKISLNTSINKQLKSD